MKKTQKIINLGLQGGGAHGAFAWGVLDYLLEDGRIGFEGVSATSAGSVNAVVLAQGLLRNDRDEARQVLYDFWEAVSGHKKYGAFKSLYDVGGNGTDQFSLENSPFYIWFDMVSHIMSPYQFNPLNFNPLEDMLNEHVDFEALRKHNKLKIFICATNVQTGKIKIFPNEELSSKAVLASACLPQVFQAVEINNEFYWDGGYMGNPAIFPLIYNCRSSDVVIVHINPIVRMGVPKTAEEILNRINEISFNSTLMREMRAVAFVTSLIESQAVESRSLKKMYVHSIRSDEEMTTHDISSKMNTDWKFLTFLRDRGRLITEMWLKTTINKIGKDSTIDVRQEFL